MELKVKLPSILNPRDWPSCTQSLKTLSFRAPKLSCDDHIDRLFHHHSAAADDTPTSLSTHSTASSSSSATDSLLNDDNEAIIRGAHSETRLFFDPSSAKNILPDADDRKKKKSRCVLEESAVAVAMESEDPYMDFSRSMEEMVEAHQGIMERWDCLEELLAWYLSVNGRDNHGYILGAFMDLLVKFSSSLNLQGCGSFCSAGSSFSSDQQGG